MYFKVNPCVNYVRFPHVFCMRFFSLTRHNFHALCVRIRMKKNTCITSPIVFNGNMRRSSLAMYFYQRGFVTEISACHLFHVYSEEKPQREPRPGLAPMHGANPRQEESKICSRNQRVSLGFLPRTIQRIFLWEQSLNTKKMQQKRDVYYMVCICCIFKKSTMGYISIEYSGTLIRGVYDAQFSA